MRSGKYGRTCPVWGLPAWAEPLPGFEASCPGKQTCWDARKRCTGMSMDEARRALAEGVQVCPRCRPDVALGME
ncbi:DUF6233 domain-containing protein [Streptomyces sp. WM6372]|uniref:DUF6233 domain-containing protein n=1 Tax=Streptomyces sp. WM6372 TaxID=1415555 RepID=UPI0022772E82|nr:DUF6233 domain-containing protein [Streptomyces sp. WM6372]